MNCVANTAAVTRKKKKETREGKQNGLGRRRIRKESVKEEYVVWTTISFKLQVSVQEKLYFLQLYAVGFGVKHSKGANIVQI
jgi:hypothetical protein